MLSFHRGELFALIICVFADLCQGQGQGQSTVLSKKSLDKFPLAQCNDGSPATYYHDQTTSKSGGKVLIYLPNDPDLDDCSSARGCDRKCEKSPQSCTSSEAETLRMSEGIWSQETRNSPFANHFKVLLPSCSSDEFSGTRGSSEATSNLVFHGRHIFNSLLRDLVQSFDLESASEVVLVGSGSGARGAARNCDHLTEAVATVNSGAKVRCILDGIDLVPFWVKEADCKTAEEKEEAKKFLWGRSDDESCLEENKDKLNSTALALECGTFSRYWKHVSTDFFVTSSQLDPRIFEEETCGVRSSDDDYTEYTVGWRQGILTLAEALSVGKPESGWFIPNCDNVPFFLDENHAKERREVRIAPLDEKSPSSDEEADDKEELAKQNVLQTIYNWLKKGDDFQAIDAFGVPNDACSAQKSLPLDLRPDALLGDIESVEESVQSGPVSSPIRRFGQHRTSARRGPFFGGFRGRFSPPADIFPGAIGAGAGRNDFVGAANDFLFDYDEFNLGADYDFALQEGVAPAVDAAVPGVGVGGLGAVPARGHAVVPVAAVDHVVTPVVARPATVAGPYKHGYYSHGGKVVHTQGRRASLWRRLYYLEYLRKAYNREYQNYHSEYYGTGLNVGGYGSTLHTAPVVKGHAKVGYANRGHHAARGYPRRRFGHLRGFARIQEKPKNQKSEDSNSRVKQPPVKLSQQEERDVFEDPDDQFEQISF